MMQMFYEGNDDAEKKNAGGEIQDRKERHLWWAFTAHTRRLKKARLCNWEGRGQVFLKLFVVI